MGFLSWILFGLLAGAVAKLLMPGKDPGGCIVTILLGVAGAILGGWIGTQFGFGTVRGFELGSFLIAVMGALLILIVYRILLGRKKR